jgi:hypothetical protein
LFAGYANTNSAVGHFTIDTTTMTNGGAHDRVGRARFDGKGARHWQPVFHRSESRAARGKSLSERECDRAYAGAREEVDECGRRLASAPDRREDRFWKSNQPQQHRDERHGAALETPWRPDTEERAHQSPKIQRAGMHQQPLANIVVTADGRGAFFTFRRWAHVRSNHSP